MLTAPTTDRPTMYTTTWCGYCVRLKSQLKRAGIDFDEVDIEDHADGAALVARGQRRQPDRADRALRRRHRADQPSVGQVSGKLAALS